MSLCSGMVAVTQASVLRASRCTCQQLPTRNGAEPVVIANSAEW